MWIISLHLPANFACLWGNKVVHKRLQSNTKKERKGVREFNQKVLIIERAEACAVIAYLICTVDRLLSQQGSKVVQMGKCNGPHIEVTLVSEVLQQAERLQKQEKYETNSNIKNRPTQQVKQQALKHLLKKLSFKLFFYFSLFVAGGGESEAANKASPAKRPRSHKGSLNPPEIGCVQDTMRWHYPDALFSLLISLRLMSRGAGRARFCAVRRNKNCGFRELRPTRPPAGDLAMSAGGTEVREHLRNACARRKLVKKQKAKRKKCLRVLGEQNCSTVHQVRNKGQDNQERRNLRH